MKLYWITWGVLLVFTVLMLWMDSASLPRTLFIVAMLGAMLIKASMIGGNFMHLRREQRTLAAIVVIGLLGMGTVLYVLIVPDALRIHRMTVAHEQATSAPR